jgi:hypothetical protein
MKRTIRHIQDNDKTKFTKPDIPESSGLVRVATAAVFIVAFCLVFLQARSQAFTLFKKAPVKHVALAFKAKFLAFQEKMPEDRVYLSCDKPFYFPGETVWFQAYVRNGGDLKPSVKSGILHVEWIAPSGSVVRDLQLIVRNGTASGNIDLDGTASGGIYKLKAYTSWQKNFEEPAIFEKEVPVQTVVLPRLMMKMDYMRQSYGPGDEVMARLDVKTRDNAPHAGKEFRYTVLLGGKTVKEYKAMTRKDGAALIRFQLPDKLDTADGLLSVVIPFEGRNESIMRSIPILATRLNVNICPEGGDLVAGIESRVAVKATDEFGKPADISAVIENSAGKSVAEFDTLHKGMGSFRIKPLKNQGYILRIVKPKGVSTVYSLPECLERGFALSASVKDGKRIDVSVRSTEELETMTLTLRSRGSHFDERVFSAKKGDNHLSFDVSSFPMGVVQVTLFDSKNIERAERLCFVQQKKQMKITVATDKKSYGPREKVSMTVKTADDRGVPVPAQLTLSVVDDSLMAFADDRQGHILSKLLLEPDLKGEVFEPAFYFDEKEKNREEALDLLMLTQGWRRFTWKAVLADTPPAVAYPAETAEIRGVVYTGSGPNEPAAGAKVTVEGTGKSVVADEKGNFVIRDLDLYKAENLVASKGDKTGSPVRITDYANPVTLYLTPRYPDTIMFKGREKGLALPMAAGMGRPDVIEEAVGAEEADRVKKDAPIPVAPPLARAEKEEKPKREMAMDIMDPRFGGRIRPHVIPPEEEKQPVYVRARVFPDTVYTTTETATRNDFRSTLCFKGLVETDRRGVAHVTFYNSDAVTTFRTSVEGIGADGLAGRAEQTHTTALPFSLDVKIPVSVSMGDEVNLPLTIVNNSGKIIEGTLDITVPKGFRSLGPLNLMLSVENGQARTLPLPFIVADSPGKTQLKVGFKTGADTETLVKDMVIAPRGFPVSVSLSSQEKDKTWDISIDDPVMGTLGARFTAYPTVLSDLLKGIEAILQEPYGCFEQASSSTYPNILVLDYLKEQKDPDPAVMKKASDLIARGYNRLVTYETKEKGYEWFGEKPGHEALSAYGLMEFKDMERVWQGVDPAMVKRTADWLLSRKDGKGGFARNEKALDSFGRADNAITNAYIVYALSEAGYTYEIKAELEKAFENAKKSNDPYQLALVANALFTMKDPRKDEILKALLAQRKEDGSFTGLTTSVTFSTGKALTVETTALAVLAILKSDSPEKKNPEIPVRYLVSARSGYGGFGNTQSTVLALKALSAFAKFSRRTAEDGHIVIYVNGKAVAGVSYTKGQSGEVVIPEADLSGAFKEGPSKIRVVYENVANPLPYTFALTYNTFVPSSSKDCPLKLSTELSVKDVKEGNPVRMTVTLENLEKSKGQPMSLAVIGIPGGLSLVPKQLKELQDKKIVDYLEVLGSNLVIYYRQMKPGETKTILLDLKAEIPGKYEAAASSAYLYYGSENKSWVKGEVVTVTE